jgi:hypothetical protein
MTYIRKTTDLFVSQDLRRVLEEINSTSEVARLLLKGRHPKEDLIEEHPNYISLSVTNPEMISYLTPERLQLVDVDEIWTSKRRFIAKPGAFVNKIFKNISSKEIEIFSNLYKSVQNPDSLNFRIVSGEEIIDWYNEKNYSSGTSSLNSSCMRYSFCKNFFEIYVENPDVVKLLILTNNNNKLLGRALLWNTQVKVMDRIYTVKDEKYAFQFKKWASDNGYIWKKEQKWNNTLYFTDDIQTSLLNLSVKLENFSCEDYPYLDTFKFFDTKEGILYNWKPDNANIRILNAANGRCLSNDSLELDYYSKLYHNKEEMSYLDYLNAWVSSSDTRYSLKYNCYIHLLDAKWSANDKSYIFGDEMLNQKYQPELNTQIVFQPVLNRMVV